VRRFSTKLPSRPAMRPVYLRSTDAPRGTGRTTFERCPCFVQAQGWRCGPASRSAPRGYRANRSRRHSQMARSASRSCSGRISSAATHRSRRSAPAADLAGVALQKLKLGPVHRRDQAMQLASFEGSAWRQAVVRAIPTRRELAHRRNGQHTRQCRRSRSIVSMAQARSFRQRRETSFPGGPQGRRRNRVQAQALSRCRRAAASVFVLLHLGALKLLV